MARETHPRLGRRRAIAATIASLAVASVALGMTGPLIALLLERRGVGATIIGLNSATPALAVLALTLVLPQTVRALGPLASLLAGLALWAAATLMMPVFTGLGAWFALRFLLGLGLAVHSIVGEVWINTLAGERARGRIIGTYVTTSAAGFALGPAALPLLGLEGWTPFAATAAVIAASALPLAFARGAAAGPMPQRVASVAQFIRFDPLVMVMALVAGFCDTALVSLLPVFGVERGMAWEQTVTFLAVLLAGNAVLQAPVGWLADRVDRRITITCCALLVAAGASLLPVLFERPGPLVAVLFVWGGAEFGLYTLGLVRLGHRFRGEELAGANTAFALMYGVGNLVGPSVAGGAMDLWGPIGLPIAIAGAATFLVMVAVRHWFMPVRRRPKMPVPSGDPSRSVVPPAEAPASERDRPESSR